ncbi:MAG: phosphatase PAP2 family protein, partial [Leptolyngbyaceae cyanobacterium CAN_BIN12]|nr:phosphatase PAP2 family protein [Leptolyngbyaceae cyanobacterium CAN_BIN12]
MKNLSIPNHFKNELFIQALDSPFSSFREQFKQSDLSLGSGLTWATGKTASRYPSPPDLTIRYREVDLPRTLSPQDIGEVKVVVSNQGGNSLTSPLVIKLYASTDATLDSKDEQLGTLQTQTFTLQPGQAETYTLQFSNPTSIAIGAYNLIASLDTTNSIGESNDSNNSVSQRVSAPGSDAVIQWNATTLNAIRTALSSPPEASRALAMVHTAMYDAVNSVEQWYRPYFVNIDPEIVRGASLGAAATAAAYTVLRSLYPDQTTTFKQQLALSLASVPIDVAAGVGLALGGFVAAQILDWRSTDGSKTIVPYTPGTDPGQWQPTPPAFAPAFLPQWAEITPFAMTSGSQFRPPAPPDLDSARYAADLNLTQELGRKDSAIRTADQTEIALLWADGANTFTPPGHWNQIAEQVAVQEGNTLLENARLFALLNISLADAAIVAWDAKYNYNFWRPITAIQQADRDYNPATTADPTWTPLLTTPPFSEHTSGHSTFSGAASTVLTDFFGEHYAFSTTSLDLPGVTRRYSSFAAAADEAGISRIYGGIHFSSANEDGLAS